MSERCALQRVKSEPEWRRATVCSCVLVLVVVETNDSNRRRANVSRTARHDQLGRALFIFAGGSE